MKKHLFTLKKSDRLTSRKLIGQLFDKGKSDLIYPVKVVFLKIENESNIPTQAAFSVSKKNFKKAVDRNLLKRRMKESYRLNKPDFYKRLTDEKYSIMFIYVAREILPSLIIEKSIIRILKKLAK